MNKDLTVLEAKRYGIYSCQQDSSLYRVSSCMVEEDVSALVIVDDEEQLAGIITHTDLLRAAMEQGEAWRDLPAEAYMTKDVVTVSPAATLGEVAELLLQHNIHRVVVVSSEEGARTPIAVVSSSDLVYHMVQ